MPLIYIAPGDTCVLVLLFTDKQQTPPNKFLSNFVNTKKLNYFVIIFFFPGNKRYLQCCTGIVKSEYPMLHCGLCIFMHHTKIKMPVTKICCFFEKLTTACGTRAVIWHVLCSPVLFLGGGIEGCRNRNKHSLLKGKEQQCHCSFPKLLWLYCFWDSMTVKNWLFLVFVPLSPDYQGWFVADWLWGGSEVLPSAAAQAVPLRGERQEADGAGLQHEGELGHLAAAPASSSKGKSRLIGCGHGDHFWAKHTDMVQSVLFP